MAEIEDLVDGGQITRKDAERYKAEVLFPRQVEQEIDKRDRARLQRDAEVRPLERAARDIQKYVKEVPWLADDSDQRTQEIGVKHRELVRDFGYPDNWATKRVAIEMSLGPLDKIRGQREVANLTQRGTSTHAAPSAGGPGSEGKKSDVVAKVPKEMVDYWRSTGASEDQVKKYAEHHLAKATRRRAQFG